LGPDIAICHGELYELDSHYDNPNSTVYWSTGEHTPTIFLTSAGDYAVRVAVTNDDGLTCVGADTVNVYVSPKPIPEFTASDTVGCAPLDIHFTNRSVTNDTMGMSFRWIIFDEHGNIVSTSDKVNPDLRFENEGHYTVRLVVLTDEGCTDSITKVNYLTINYQPLAEFDALPEVSLWSETNGSIFFQVQGDTLEFGDDMGFYWDFGDGSIDSSSYALEHSYSSWGDYDVTLFMFTPEGCNSSITHTVTLEADLIFPNVITPNGDGVNDVFAIGNLNTSMNNYDPDRYRNNELTIYDRWGKQVYHALNYDTFKDMTGERGDGIIVGEQVFDAAKVTDGTYYFTFYYKGKFKTVNYHGTLQIIRDR
jgi:PKD repeat protein